MNMFFGTTELDSRCWNRGSAKSATSSFNDDDGNHRDDDGNHRYA